MKKANTESASSPASVSASTAGPPPVVPIDVEVEDASQSMVGEERGSKKLKSVWWDNFDVVRQGKFVIATCKFCKKVLEHETKNGTTRIKNHTDRCKKNPNRSIMKGQAQLGKTSNSSEPSIKVGPHKFDENVERKKFAKMIAKHDYPFLMAEHSYFREWVTCLLPTYKFRSRTTVRKDLDAVYEQEKSRIYGELEEVAYRVSLTTDAWKPVHQSRSYFCLTCHYVDCEWKLHKHVIAFHVVPYPHAGVDMSKWLKERILEWNLDKKLSCDVVDNATNNSGMLHGVKDWLNGKNALLSQGDMFHMRCAPHIINLIVKSGLERLKGFIDSIIKTQRHIKNSPAREEKFAIALKHYRFNPNRRIPSDVDTRWNSTYYMLLAAIELKDVIKRYGELDSSYIDLPSDDQWKDGEKICNCLKVFEETTKTLSGSLYPTANYYFLEIQKVRQCIKEWRESDDLTISSMAFGMQSKFDKYWDECNKLLTVAGVLDPRFKLPIVNFFFQSIYGNDSMKEDEFRRYLFGLYDEYKVIYGGKDVEDNARAQSSSFVDSLGYSSSTSKIMKSLSNFLVEKNVVTSYGRKNELEEYLEEALQPMDDKFHILGW